MKNARECEENKGENHKTVAGRDGEIYYRNCLSKRLAFVIKRYHALVVVSPKSHLLASRKVVTNISNI